MVEVNKEYPHTGRKLDTSHDLTFDPIDNFELIL
jgi:hypothetical protein